MLTIFSICNAQENIPNPKRERITLELPSTPPPIDEHSILEQLETVKKPASKSDGNILLDEAPKEYAPGEIHLKYDGIEGVIVGKLLFYQRRLWSLSIDNAYNHGGISYQEYQARLQQRADLESDAQQERWWDRTWYQSLIPEQGGAAPTKTIVIGKELAVFEFGEITLSNTGQIRFGDFFFSFYNLSSSTSTDPRNASATTTTTAANVAYGLTHSEDVSITDLVQISIKPRVTIKGTLIPGDVISNISVETRFRFYTSNNKKVPWSQLTVSVDSAPMTGIASASINFELLCW